MRKNITQEQYLIEAKNNPDALNTEHFLEGGKSENMRLKWMKELDSITNFLLVYNRYPYSEWAGQEVKAHYLLIPRDDNIIEYSELIDILWQLPGIIKGIKKHHNIEEKGSKTLSVAWKENNKSIEKFHFHIFVTEDKIER